MNAQRADYYSRSPERHARQTVETYYREQLRQIERALHLKPHPRVAAQLLMREIGLLEKLLDVVHENASTKRKIAERIKFAKYKLEKARS